MVSTQENKHRIGLDFFPSCITHTAGPKKVENTSTLYQLNRQSKRLSPLRSWVRSFLFRTEKSPTSYPGLIWLISPGYEVEKSLSTSYRKLWIFSKYSSFLPQRLETLRFKTAKGDDTTETNYFKRMNGQKFVAYCRLYEVRTV